MLYVPGLSNVIFDPDTIDIPFASFVELYVIELDDVLPALVCVVVS